MKQKQIISFEMKGRRSKDHKKCFWFVEMFSFALLSEVSFMKKLVLWTLCESVPINVDVY